MRSGQLSYMHRPRFAYACKLRRQSLGPETRNPIAHFCTLSGRNDKRPTHLFKMLADSIVSANKSNAKARVAVRNRLSESAVQHWNENAYRLRACSTQELAIILRDMHLKATKAGLRQTATPGATGCFAHPSPGMDENVGPTLESMSTRQKLATGAQRALLTQTHDAHCVETRGQHSSTREALCSQPKLRRA